MVSDDELHIVVYRDESTVSVRLTHLPTGLVAIGTDSRYGSMRGHPSSAQAKALAMKRLEEDLAS
jgi:protein subunit release factor A